MPNDPPMPHRGITKAESPMTKTEAAGLVRHSGFGVSSFLGGSLVGHWALVIPRSAAQPGVLPQLADQLELPLHRGVRPAEPAGDLRVRVALQLPHRDLPQLVVAEHPQ